MATPRCFITHAYSSDSEEENSDLVWIARLTALLERSGVDVHWDKQDVHPGMDLAKYVETSIRISDFVLLICTPTFAQKVNGRVRGVGFENQIIAGEILEGSFSQEQIVPILRKGNRKESIPSYAKGKVYIDFRDDKVFDEKFKGLLEHIFTSHKKLHISRKLKSKNNTFSLRKKTKAAQSSKPRKAQRM